MAKFGIALGSGPRGLGFESRHSDQNQGLQFAVLCFFIGILTAICEVFGRERRGTLTVVYIILGILLGILAVISGFFLILSLLCIPISAKKTYDSDSRFYRWLLNVCSALAVWVARARLHVTGEEKLPKGRKILFVGNHISNYDPIFTWYVFRKWRITYISKASNFKIPWFGRIIRRCCFLDIDRENPRNAIVTINRAADFLERQHVSIGVYPEGTRSKTGELLPFHNGVFKIAQKAEVDIAVVGITGTSKIAKNLPFRSTDVYIDVLAVIPGEQVKAMRTELIGNEVKQLLQENKKRREKNEKDICAV